MYVSNKIIYDKNHVLKVLSIHKKVHSKAIQTLL